MRCPFCKSENIKVIDKRESSETDVIRRRRECLSCEKRFTTHERMDLGDFFVIKKDENREQFDRDKIKRGIMKAIEKRPVTMEQVEQMVDEIEAKIRSSEEKEIPSKKIGELVIRSLRKMDKVAYIRFASVYKDFADVESFEEEIKKLLRR
jgi:transcriptional repressor NrdR